MSPPSPSGSIGPTPTSPGESRLPTPEETPVFIVDDDEGTVEALCHFLEQRGYQATGFLRPEDARDAIREDPPHLLIVDRSMPGMGGFDLARDALEEDPDIGVVILTGAREVEMAVQAFRLGASDYLLKPLDFDEIEKSVRRVLIRRGQEIYHRKTEAQMRRDVEERTRELNRKSVLHSLGSVGIGG